MPGLESTSNQIGRIDPSSLIGKAEAVVEPRATAALVDAFRSGIVTADDIVSRVGELGKSKDKAQILAAQEATSPEAQALRAQQTAAGTAQAGLAEAEALRAQVLQKFPNVANFDKFAGGEGVKQPKLPDGSPDYERMDELGAELLLFNKRKERAKTELENIDPHFDKEARIISAVTKQGQPVAPTRVPELTAIVNSPFAPGQAPGTFQAAPTAAPSVEPRSAPAQAAAPSVAPAPVVTPTASSVPPVGTPVAGGFSMGPLPAPPPKPMDETERALKIEAAKSVLPVIDNAVEAIKRGRAVGPGKGSIPAQSYNYVASIFGFREQEFKDQRNLEIGISSKILEGAQVMKGNLSDKDVRFLKDTVPKLSDEPEIWKTYLNKWRAMAQANIDILEGKIPKPQVDLFAPKGWTPPADSEEREKAGNLFSPASTTPSAPVRVNSPAEAPPTAQFIQAPDGRVFKNPNYRSQ